MRPAAHTLASLLLLAALPLSGWAASRDTLADPKLAARIDGSPLPLASLQLLHRVAAKQDMRTPLSKVLASVIDNRLLGDYALREYGDAKLFTSTGVAFSREVAVEDQLVATLRRAHGLALDKSLTELGGLDKLVQQRHAPSPAALAEVFGNADRLRLNNLLTAEQLQAAKQVALLDYRLPGEPSQRITLYEVWLRQNVQGRVAMSNGDAGYLAQQAMQLLASRYVLYWAGHEGGLSSADLAALRQAVVDRDRRGALLQLMGIEADMHYDSLYLKQLAATVSTDEVRDYYTNHPAEFRHLDQVKARHIRCADEACTRAATAKLASGVSFADVAKALSISDDAKQGGQLGWLQTKDGGADWLSELAFALPAGKPSRPVRSPAAAGQAAVWEIMLVEEKQESMQPLDSEAVRYIASQAIARKKALAAFKALRERLFRQADIELNPDTLGFGGKTLAKGD